MSLGQLRSLGSGNARELSILRRISSVERKLEQVFLEFETLKNILRELIGKIQENSSKETSERSMMFILLLSGISNISRISEENKKQILEKIFSRNLDQRTETETASLLDID
jgi:hypothetical protein